MKDLDRVRLLEYSTAGALIGWLRLRGGAPYLYHSEEYL